MLIDCDFLNKDFWFMNEEYKSEGLFPVTSIFAGKVDFFVKLFEGVDTIDDFVKVAQPTNVLEWFFKEKIKNLTSGHIEQINPRNCFTSEWLGISNSGNVKIPGINYPTFNFDIVRNFNTTDNIIFTFKSGDSESKFIIRGSINDTVVFSDTVSNNFFRWHMQKVRSQDIIKFEIFDKDNQLLKQVSYKAESILNNELSYIKFK